MTKLSELKLRIAREQLEKEWSEEARGIYKTLFGTSLPKKWQIWWNVAGLTIQPKNHKSVKWLIAMDGGLQSFFEYETLIHEFFHVRGYAHQPMLEEAVHVITELYSKYKKQKQLLTMINKKIGKNAIFTGRSKSSR